MSCEHILLGPMSRAIDLRFCDTAISQNPAEFVGGRHEMVEREAQPNPQKLHQWKDKVVGQRPQSLLAAARRAGLFELNTWIEWRCHAITLNPTRVVGLFQQLLHPALNS